MGYNIFLDVNILVDFFLDSRSGNNDAQAIIRLCENYNAYGFVSESVINTTTYITRKSVKAEMYKHGIKEMLAFIELLPCSAKTIISAYHNAKNDLEDAVLYQIALEHKMDYFVTSDIKDYKKIQHPLLPVVTAKQILEIIK